jgi:hypothetical protein
MTSEPKAPGAPAIILSYEETTTPIQKQSLGLARRAHNVYVTWPERQRHRYPHGNMDRHGFSVESLPASASMELPDSLMYRTAAQSVPYAAGSSLNVSSARVFVLGHIDFPVTAYPQIHKCFEQIAAHDQEQIILRIKPANTVPQ